MALAGLSVQQDHWKDNTSRKLENSYHSANRTSWTVQESSVILVVKEDSWIMLSSKGSNDNQSFNFELQKSRRRENPFQASRILKRNCTRQK